MNHRREWWSYRHIQKFHFIFLLRKRIMLMFFSFILLRLWEINSPAFEKSLSDRTEDTGEHRNLLAWSWSFGKRSACSFHHERGFSSLEIGASSEYLRNSIMGPVVFLYRWFCNYLHFGIKPTPEWCFSGWCSFLWIRCLKQKCLGGSGEGHWSS